MVDITIDFLQKQIARASVNKEVTMPSYHLRAILDLALRAKLAESNPATRPSLRVISPP